jgi:class 3 adenylate cyclase
VSELRTAWREWCDAGAPYEAGDVRLLLARAYRAAGDLPGAKLEAEGARDLFARIGAHTRTQRAEALIAELSGAAEARKIRTFMFTDIVDSSRLVELLGDDSWSMLLSWHDRALRSCFTAHQGEEIKHEGDGFFVTFPSADAAVCCAQAVQRSMNEHRREHGFAPQIRIGVHTDEATSRGGDYVGRGVHIAARVASAGGAGEILASEQTLAGASENYPVLETRTAALKGLAEPLQLARIDWS